MSKIFVTSDMHFGHDKEVLYKSRSFESIQEHDEAVIERWNAVVDKNDDVYILGDLFLYDKDHGKSCIERLNGKLHVMLGNHDTSVRKQMYVEEIDSIVEVQYATVIKYRKCHFYLSHYPTMTANSDADTIHNSLIDLYGHTHQKDKFFHDFPFMYHVGLDAHNCTPVLLDDVIEDVKVKIEEMSYLPF